MKSARSGAAGARVWCYMYRLAGCLTYSWPLHARCIRNGCSPILHVYLTPPKRIFTLAEGVRIQTVDVLQSTSKLGLRASQDYS
jgi:hypothetical protein